MGWKQLIVALAFTATICPSAATPSGSATKSMNATSQPEDLNAVIEDGLDEVTEGCACATARQLRSLNSSFHNENACVAGDTAYNKSEPFYQMEVSFSGGRPLPRANLFKTLAFAYDFGLYEWSHRQWQGGKFQPESFYNIKIDFSRAAKGPLHRDFVGWLVDTIVFWMRDKNNFAEMTGKVYDKRTFYGQVTVRLVDANSVAPPNESLPGAVGDSPGSFNATLSSDSTMPSYINSGSLPASSKRDEVSTNRTIEANPVPAAPHRFRPEVIRTEISGTTRIGGADIELDLMATLFCMARQALDHARQQQYACHAPPDRTVVKVEPVEDRSCVLGKEMIESLVDIVDWLYMQLQTTGNFWSFEATTVRKAAAGWVPAAEWSVYLA